MNVRSFVSTASALSVASWAGVVAACPVCGAARDEANQMAFISMTAFMTFLPLTVLGGLAWWLVRRVRRLEHEGSEPGPDGVLASTPER